MIKQIQERNNCFHITCHYDRECVAQIKETIVSADGIGVWSDTETNPSSQPGAKNERLDHPDWPNCQHLYLDPARLYHNGVANSLSHRQSMAASSADGCFRSWSNSWTNFRPHPPIHAWFCRHWFQSNCYFSSGTIPAESPGWHDGNPVLNELTATMSCKGEFGA